MGDVINFPRRDALFTQQQRMYYAQRLHQAHGLNPEVSSDAVHAMEVEMCETIVSKARQVARIVGHRLGKKLFRLITKE